MAKTLGIIGFGTVGQGFLEVLINKHKEFQDVTGDTVRLIGIIGRSKGSIVSEEGIDPRDAITCIKQGLNLNQCFPELKSMDALEFIKKLKPDVLVEAIPTNLENGEPAYSYIRTALELGSKVVTANKGPIALHYEKLKKYGDNLRFEATVMSGTPVIGFIKENLPGNRILEIRGILNGTTNFILDQMEHGKEYSEALKEAQKRGYAEANPDADVKGFDALAKIVILAKVMMNYPISINEVAVRGIDTLTMKDVEEAKKQGKKWKLIAQVSNKDGKISASVAPVMIGAEDPLYHVSGTWNGVVIKTDILGEIFLKGPGAGKLETGYAVFLDLIKVLKKCFV